MQLKTTWNFDALNTTDKNIEDTKRAVTKFVTNWKGKQDYLQDPEVLYQTLDEFDDLHKKYGVTGDSGYYWGLRHSLDMANPQITAEMNKIDELGTNLQNELQFFCLRLCKIGSKKQNEFLNNPKLAEFRHFLEKLFKEGRYTLSEPEEKILNLKSNVARNNWIRLTETLLGQEIYRGKTLTQLMGDLKSHQKNLRDRAAVGIDGILKKNVNVAEHELNSVLADKKINDELRKAPRPDSMRHLADDIDSEVVDMLSKAVSDRFDISARYYALKARSMGVKKLKYHERLAPVGKITGQYNYQKSCGLINSTFKQLDPEFGKIFERFAVSGQIDVYPKVGKRGGAFCAAERLTTPTYILLNHTGKLQDVLTIAHEAGHGINNELMRSQKRAVNFGSPLCIAEVASTFMEDFVLQKLLAESKPDQKFALIMQKLDDDVSTIFRQIACYRFETELHSEFRKKGYLSKGEIGSIFSKNVAAYMGSCVDQPKPAQNYWVYWSHIRNYFYVYSYSFGLLISKILQARVKKDPQFIKSVKVFLSSGLSDSPEAIFKSLNIDIFDINTWNTGLNEVQCLLEEAEKLCPYL